MTHRIKIGILAAATSALFVALLFFGGYKAYANPSRVQTPSACATASATTTLSYMTPGTATTTATCNMANAGSGTETFDRATIVIQLTASSTSSAINGAVEESYDGIDWYPVTPYVHASTSADFTLTNSGTFSWTFASTSVGGAGVASNNNLATRAFEIPVKMKYVRVWMGNNVGATRVGVWAQIVGKAEKFQ